MRPALASPPSQPYLAPTRTERPSPCATIFPSRGALSCRHLRPGAAGRNAVCYRWGKVTRLCRQRRAAFFVGCPPPFCRPWPGRRGRCSPLIFFPVWVGCLGCGDISEGGALVRLWHGRRGDNSVCAPSDHWKPYLCYIASFLPYSSHFLPIQGSPPSGASCWSPECCVQRAIRRRGLWRPPWRSTLLLAPRCSCLPLHPPHPILFPPPIARLPLFGPSLFAPSCFPPFFRPTLGPSRSGACSPRRPGGSGAIPLVQGWLPRPRGPSAKSNRAARLSRSDGAPFIILRPPLSADVGSL